MTITSNLANFISNLNNHLGAKKRILIQNETKFILDLTKLLVKEGFLRGYQLEDKQITFFLKYNQNKPVFQKIQMISKPGKRIYVNNKWLYKQNIPGTFILSTSKGLITHVQAKSFNVGGELICQII